MPAMVPCLMFVGDQLGRAEEAIELYVSAFPASRVLHVDRHDEGGGVRHARIEVAGQELALMDSPAAHAFTFTPAISLIVEFDDDETIDAAWSALLPGGGALMPLQAYDFAPKFGWLADRFGVTWQLILAAR